MAERDHESEDVFETKKRIEKLRADLQMIVKMDRSASPDKDDAVVPRRPPIRLNPDAPSDPE